MLHRHDADPLARRGPRIAVGHVHERPLGAGHDRPDTDARRFVDQGVDRKAEEIFGPFCFQDVRDCARRLHGS